MDKNEYIDNFFYIRYMFYNCKSLKILPDLSKWDTTFVNDMSYMFYGCESLEELPDISKWITDNIINMSYMFTNCFSLKNLPDISKWKFLILEI